jgi:hypothetical protein
MIDRGPVDVSAPAIIPNTIVADMSHVMAGAIPMDRGMETPPPA